jgi:hypothetical protein
LEPVVQAPHTLHPEQLEQTEPILLSALSPQLVVEAAENGDLEELEIRVKTEDQVEEQEQMFLLAAARLWVVLLLLDKDLLEVQRQTFLEALLEEVEAQVRLVEMEQILELLLVAMVVLACSLALPELQHITLEEAEDLQTQRKARVALEEAEMLL